MLKVVEIKAETPYMMLSVTPIAPHPSPQIPPGSLHSSRCLSGCFSLDRQPHAFARGRREERAKTEDGLFLGWLSPTPWKAGCQLGGVAGQHSPVCNAAPMAARLRQAQQQKRSRDLNHLSAVRDPEPV